MPQSSRVWDVNVVRGIGLVLLLLGSTLPLQAQYASPSIPFKPRSYVCYKSPDSLRVDGHLDEAGWQQAPWTSKFVDIEGRTQPEPRYATQAKMLWDDEYLYIAARLQEPHVWGTLTKRDTVMFYNNDFEVFLDPDGDTHHYYELEVNALGAWWDLMLTKPYRDGGRPIDAWDIRGIKIGIAVDGTLNHPGDIDSSWTVELALPWEVLEEAAPGGRPTAGDQWRINFSRVQWQHAVENGKYRRKRDSATGKLLDESNWVWSPQGVVNMHYPEMWGYLQFAGPKAKAGSVGFKEHPKRWIKWYLRKLYYREHQWKQKSGSYTSQKKDLHTDSLFKKFELSRLFPGLQRPRIYATRHTFEIRMQNPQNSRVWYIREDGRIWSSSNSSKPSE